jgi:hypothetical protein
MKKTSIIKQVLALQNQSIQELKQLWVQLFDEPAPPYQKNYLLPRLAHRLQELAYGPISEKAATTLDNLANQMEKGKKFSNPMLSGRPTVGTKLIREFQGEDYGKSLIAWMRNVCLLKIILKANNMKVGRYCLNSMMMVVFLAEL